MINKRFRTITVIEASATIISTIIGVGVLAIPRLAVEAANTGAPLITVGGIVIAFFGLWVITRLGTWFPSESIVQYSPRIVGKWPAFIGSVLLISFFAALTALASREFGEVVVTAVLQKTPVEVTTMVMLLLAAICSRTNMTTFAYAHLFYLPFIIGPALLIIVLSTKNLTVLNLQPLLGNSPNVPHMLVGTLTVAALFQGAFIATVVIPAMRNPKDAMKSSVWGMAISGTLYLLIVIATLGVFGSEELKLLMWPTLELAKTTAIPGEVLERLDALFLIVWVTAVFTTLYSTYSLTARAMKDLCGLKDHRMMCFFIFPFIFLIAMLPPDILRLYEVIELVGRFGLVLTIAYPLLLLCTARLRKMRGEVAGES